MTMTMPMTAVWISAIAAVSSELVENHASTIAGVSNSEADYLYYEAEAEFGSGPANRLYGVYHQLKNKCQHNPRA